MNNGNNFRSKGPELLVELAQHTASTIKEVVEIDTAIAEQIGEAVANRMMQVWGGQSVYFPMGTLWRISQRDHDIFNDINGRNHHDLARKWVYSVIKRVRKAEIDRLQGRLFDGDGELGDEPEPVE